MSVDESAEPHKKSDEVRCKRCNAVTRLAHKILNVGTGGIVRTRPPNWAASRTFLRAHSSLDLFDQGLPTLYILAHPEHDTKLC